MSIGTVIRKLRREQGITQEQLAEYLHVSSQAISGWECDRNAPDLSQIAPLTKIFGVSADVLLEIEYAKEMDEVEKIIRQAKDESPYNTGEYHDCYCAPEVLEAGLKKYPRNPVLNLHLAEALIERADLKQRHDEPYSNEEMLHDFAMAEEICRNLLDDSRDTDIRSRAASLLITACSLQGKTEEAYAWVEKQPDMEHSREYLRYTAVSRQNKETNLRALKEALIEATFIQRNLIRELYFWRENELDRNDTEKQLSNIREWIETIV